MTAHPAPQPLGPLARGLALPVHAYVRFVSPLLPPRCRFAPTCSAYALEALQVHGAGRGSWLAARRVARCHPFHPGGHDPVPPARRGVEDHRVPTPPTTEPTPTRTSRSTRA